MRICRVQLSCQVSNLGGAHGRWMTLLGRSDCIDCHDATRAQRQRTHDEEQEEVNGRLNRIARPVLGEGVNASGPHLDCGAHRPRAFRARKLGAVGSPPLLLRHRGARRVRRDLLGRALAVLPRGLVSRGPAGPEGHENNDTTKLSARKTDLGPSLHAHTTVWTTPRSESARQHVSRAPMWVRYVVLNTPCRASRASPDERKHSCHGSSSRSSRRCYYVHAAHVWAGPVWGAAGGECAGGAPRATPPSPPDGCF
jgi:hypothetical protein